MFMNGKRYEVIEGNRKKEKKEEDGGDIPY
jgi:hypothetical protein